MILLFPSPYNKIFRPISNPADVESLAETCDSCKNVSLRRATIFLPSLLTADVGEASEARVAGLRVFVEGCWRWRCALKVLRERFDRISDLSADWKFLWLCVAVHAETLAAIWAANSREVAVFVFIALLNIPKAFGELVFGAAPRNAKES